MLRISLLAGKQHETFQFNQELRQDFSFYKKKAKATEKKMNQDGRNEYFNL